MDSALKVGDTCYGMRGKTKMPAIVRRMYTVWGVATIEAETIGDNEGNYAGLHIIGHAKDFQLYQVGPETGIRPLIILPDDNAIEAIRYWLKHEGKKVTDGGARKALVQLRLLFETLDRKAEEDDDWRRLAQTRLTDITRLEAEVADLQIAVNKQAKVTDDLEGHLDNALSLAQRRLESITTLEDRLTDAVSQLASERMGNGKTPLDEKLSHPLLDVFNEGQRARDNGNGSPYGGHTLEHCIHAAGWVQRDLRLALDKAYAELATFRSPAKPVGYVDPDAPPAFKPVPTGFGFDAMVIARSCALSITRNVNLSHRDRATEKLTKLFYDTLLTP